MSQAARWRLGCLLVLLAAALGACAREEHRKLTLEEINVYPANYKSDIVGAMHAYLNNPTRIRDAAVSEPALKSLNSRGTDAAAATDGTEASATSFGTRSTRYIVCVRFNAKKTNGEYAGVKENEAVFLEGRLDQFQPARRDTCKDAVYQPFPELGKLSR
jgi:hypothetical protein